jgi:3-hydroxyisobutyrate dehydrogenase-like beta-hydroxyacid dehydrogenase
VIFPIVIILVLVIDPAALRKMVSGGQTGVDQAATLLNEYGKLRIEDGSNGSGYSPSSILE